LIEFENEDLGVKNESLKDELTALDDKVDEAYSESRDLNKALSKVTRSISNGVTAN
jgi:hypothetical protein